MFTECAQNGDARVDVVEEHDDTVHTYALLSPSVHIWSSVLVYRSTTFSLSFLHNVDKLNQKNICSMKPPKHESRILSGAALPLWDGYVRAKMKAPPALKPNVRICSVTRPCRAAHQKKTQAYKPTRRSARAAP